MNIDRLRIKGLFGLFDHHIKFHPEERIIIMIGPNGTGKTTTLRLIDVLFNRSLSRLSNIPFKNIEVLFDDDSRLSVEREFDSEQSDVKHLPLTTTYTSSDKESSEPWQINVSVDHDRLDYLISNIDDIIPILRRIGPREWLDRRTQRILDLEDVLVDFRDDLPESLHRIYPDNPEWIQNIRDSIAVRFIDTERLTGGSARHSKLRQVHLRRVRRNSPDDNSRRTVHIYSEELAGLVSAANERYGALAQSLDRSFPHRLVAEERATASSKEALRRDLSEIGKRSSQLEEAGLIVQEQAAIDIPDLDRAGESRLGVLAVYADDTKQKLRVFDDLYERVHALKKIANSRFRNKHIEVSKQGLSIHTFRDERLDLGMLSSGEQHELVILYDLLFRTPDNSIILIDEPELSLHVAWQAQFLNDLEEMAKLSNFRAILATHSPEIIGDRWNLAVELHGSNGE